MEDVFNVPQRPKVEAYGDHYLLILRMLRLTPEIEGEQVSVFFGESYVITVQERADGDVFEGVRERIRKGRGRVRQSGADYLAYALMDAVVDGYFPVLESLGERLEELEDECVLAPRRRDAAAHPGPAPRSPDRAARDLADARGGGRRSAARSRA